MQARVHRVVPVARHPKGHRLLSGAFLAAQTQDAQQDAKDRDHDRCGHERGNLCTAAHGDSPAGGLCCTPIVQPNLRARRLNGQRQTLQLHIQEAAAREKHAIEAATSCLIRAARRLDAALGIGNDRRIEVVDAFLVVPPIHVVLIDLCVQLAQQIASSIFARVRLFQCGGESPVLAILGEVRQSHFELHADEVREVAPIGVIHLDRIVRLVGLPREGNIRLRGFDLLVERCRSRDDGRRPPLNPAAE